MKKFPPVHVIVPVFTSVAGLSTLLEPVESVIDPALVRALPAAVTKVPPCQS